MHNTSHGTIPRFRHVPSKHKTCVPKHVICNASAGVVFNTAINKLSKPTLRNRASSLHHILPLNTLRRPIKILHDAIGNQLSSAHVSHPRHINHQMSVESSRMRCTKHPTRTATITIRSLQHPLDFAKELSCLCNGTFGALMLQSRDLLVYDTIESIVSERFMLSPCPDNAQNNGGPGSTYTSIFPSSALRYLSLTPSAFLRSSKVAIVLQGAMYFPVNVSA